MDMKPGSQPDWSLFPRGACSDGRVVKGAATDCMLSLTIAWVRILVLACEKVTSDLGLGVKDYSLGDDNLLSSIESTAVFYGG